MLESVMRGGKYCLAVWLLAAAGRANASESLVTVVAGGDCFPGRHIESFIGKGADPFSRLKPFLTGADLAVANLECALAGSGRPVAGKRFTFRAPAERGKLLAASGLDVLVLANNHIMDYGPAGLYETMEALSSAGLGFCGAGRDLPAARLPVLREARGLKIAFLSYSRTFPKSFWANASRPGTAYGLEEHVSADVREAALIADAVIVYLHGGREKQRELRDYQRSVAKAAMESGADLFIGAHPHVAQGIEKIGTGAAAYSLGDFVFGGKRDRHEDGLLLRATFRKTGLAALEAFALRASVLRTEGVPFLADDPAALVELELVRELSLQMGTELELGVSPEGLPRLRVEFEPADFPPEACGQDKGEEPQQE